MLKAFVQAVVGLGSLLVTTAPASAQSITPVNIGPQAHYPVPKDTIQAWILKNDTSAIRKRAWQLWEGLIADSGQVYNGQAVPIWDTWLSEAEIWPSEAPPADTAAITHRTPWNLRPFTPIHHFHRAGPRLKPAHRLTEGDAGVQLLGFNKFSPDSAKYILTPFVGQDGKSYDLRMASGLIGLNQSWKLNTPTKQRTLTFPDGAIHLKPVFLPVLSANNPKVAKNGLTVIPVWNGPAAAKVDLDNPQSPNPHPSSDTWTNCVAVSPTPTRVTTAQVDCNGTSIQAPVVPLSDFYSIKLDEWTVTQFQETRQSNNGITLVAGDYLVLVAMHVTTKEVPDWTWQTFWWSNGKSPQNSFPGGVEGMPTSLPSPWNKYAMCAAYSATKFSLPGGSPNVCFNPYLEPAFVIPNGVSSNCLGCHGMATVQKNEPADPLNPINTLSYPDNYMHGNHFTHDNPMFAGFTQTDFAWAIPSNVYNDIKTAAKVLPRLSPNKAAQQAPKTAIQKP